MKKKFYLLFPVILACFSIQNAKAIDTLSLRPNPSQGKDASINKELPSGNNGGDENYICNAWTSGGPFTQRSLVEFNLSAIKPNDTIVSAYLSLYCNTTSLHTQRHSWYPGTPYKNNLSHLKRITSSWSESTVTWGNQPTTDTTHQVELAPSTSDTQNYLNINVTQLVKDSRGTIADSTVGFMIQLDTEAYYRSFIFASSDHPNSAKRPQLVVVYKKYTSGIYSFDKSSISVYPTITNRFAYIATNNAEAKNAQIVVTDNLGRLILQKASVIGGGANATGIDLQNAATGMYFVSVTIDGFRNTYKIIRE